jgi:hypothetical protein
MATRAEKAFCVLEYARTQSIVTVQRRFRNKFENDPPVKNSIKQWYEKFQCNGCLCIARIDREMLRQMWAEIDYRLAVCRFTERGHIQHLLGMQNELE